MAGTKVSFKPLINVKQFAKSIIKFKLNFEAGKATKY